MAQKVTSVAIFTDCDDKNARFRQSLRIQQLFGVTPIITGITSDSEAGFHIVDALDATLNVEGPDEGYSIILVNIAPRDGEVRGRELNGTHFCYFWVGRALVALTFNKSMLALAKKLSLTDRILAVDIPEVTKQAVRHGLLEERFRQYICETQFRSFEFLPRLARWLVNGLNPIEYTFFLKNVFIEDLVPDARPSVAYVDRFGNVKTTLLLDELKTARSNVSGSGLGRYACLPFYPRLSNVPDDGKPAWVVGSSGFGERRFCEIVINGGRASEYFGLKAGQPLC